MDATPDFVRSLSGPRGELFLYTHFLNAAFLRWNPKLPRPNNQDRPDPMIPNPSHERPQLFLHKDGFALTFSYPSHERLVLVIPRPTSTDNVSLFCATKGRLSLSLGRLRPKPFLSKRSPSHSVTYLTLSHPHPSIAPRFFVKNAQADNQKPGDARTTGKPTNGEKHPTRKNYECCLASNPHDT